MTSDETKHGRVESRESLYNGWLAMRLGKLKPATSRVVGCLLGVHVKSWQTHDHDRAASRGSCADIQFVISRCTTT